MEIKIDEKVLAKTMKPQIDKLSKGANRELIMVYGFV